MLWFFLQPLNSFLFSDQKKILCARLKLILFFYRLWPNLIIAFFIFSFFQLFQLTLIFLIFSMRVFFNNQFFFLKEIPKSKINHPIKLSTHLITLDKVLFFVASWPVSQIVFQIKIWLISVKKASMKISLRIVK